MRTKLLHLASALTFAIALASLQHPREQLLPALLSHVPERMQAPLSSVFALASGLIETFGAHGDDPDTHQIPR